MLNYKKFIKFYILFFIIIFSIYAFLFLLSTIFVIKTKENLSIKEVIKLQKTGNYVYSQITDRPFYTYMCELFKLREPEIIAIGSSRVMQFKQDMFKKKFFTAGGIAPNMHVVKIFIEDTLKVHKPAKILLALDFWWFNPNYTNGIYFEKIEENIEKSLYDTNIQIIKYLFSGKITFSEFIFPEKYKNTSIKYNPIGFDAYKNGTGTMFDGYRTFYIEEIQTNSNYFDEKFKDTLDRINKKIKRFEDGDKLDKRALSDLNSIVKICKDKNIELILFFPPFAQRVYDELEKQKAEYKYIDNLKKYLNENGIKYFDLSNPSSLKSNNCEFIDGFHGGDVVYSRIAKKLLPNDVRDDIDKIINDNKNHVLIKFHPEDYDLKEADFLNIGCKK